jgi:hypothetical protein
MEDIYIVSKKKVKKYSNKQNEYTLNDGSVLLFDDIMLRFGVKRSTFDYRVRIYGLSDIRVLQIKKVDIIISSTKENPPKKIIGIINYNKRNMFVSDERLFYFISDIERYFGISQYKIYKFLKKNKFIDKNNIDTKNQKEKTRFNRSLFCIKNGVECDNYSSCLDEMIICRSKNKRFKPKNENCYINEKKNL